ncbi:hypothetical protein ABZS68_38585 [Streptomyces sp. NPDC005571]|uniref:hypothetical protein n=1 Tax=Streptomyces sp. NPDC005571 TaxID=3156888 RepID=UPI0033A71697
MDQMRTVLEVRFPDPHGESSAWLRYDEVLDPYFSSVSCVVDWDEDSMGGSTPVECAEQDLEEAFDTVVEEQYLARVVREGTMDVRVNMLKPSADDASGWRPLTTLAPSPAHIAQCYLSAAVRGYDRVRADLRYRLLVAHREGLAVDDLVTSVAGRIGEDEVRGLIEAEQERGRARDLIKRLCPAAPHEVSVIINADNSLSVELYPSFDQEINYEDWQVSDWWPTDCSDPWGYSEGLAKAEELLAALSSHYVATRNDKPATAAHLAPSRPSFPGVVSIKPLASPTAPCSASPSVSRIGDIARAALVLNGIWK